MSTWGAKSREAGRKSYATGKKGFDWTWKKLEPVGFWMNKQAGKMGMEAFYPTDIPNECEKAARILWTFSNRGEAPASEDVNAKKKTQKVIRKIPPSVIEKAQGLAIFTIFRTGLGWSAASGSGVVIARDSPTTWGPPSGILLHTLGFGFVAGIDVYDAVLVLRTRKAVEAFTRPKVSLGADVAIVAGPVGNGINLDVGMEAAPVYSYVKSKGIYGGIQVNGNIIIERGDENARYYGHPVKAKDILLGGAVAIPESAQVLHIVIEAAEGKEVDLSELPSDINISPSDQSGGAADEDELEAAKMAEGASDQSFPTLIETRRSSLPSSPRDIDPDEPDEKIKLRPSSAATPPPPRPPRRFVGSRSPSPKTSPRTSMEGMDRNSSEDGPNPSMS